jgi:hypothetical protein
MGRRIVALRFDGVVRNCGRVVTTLAWPMRQPWFPAYVIGMVTVLLAACIFALGQITSELLGYP